MARKKKNPTASAAPQKTESQPTQATQQPIQKNTPSGQPSTQAPAVPPKI